MCGLAHLAHVKDGSGNSCRRCLDAADEAEFGREPLDIAVAFSESDIGREGSLGESGAGTKLRSGEAGATADGVEAGTNISTGGVARVLLSPPPGTVFSNLGLGRSLGLEFGVACEGRGSCPGTGRSAVCGTDGSVLLRELSDTRGREIGKWADCGLEL